MIYNKGYQEKDEVVSAVTSKVKGLVLTNFTDLELDNVPPHWRYLYNRIWDVTDFVVPPLENNAVFVMTNVVITPNQTRGVCPEVGVWQCSSDRDCPKDGVNNLGNRFYKMLSHILYKVVESR